MKKIRDSLFNRVDTVETVLATTSEVLGSRVNSAVENVTSLLDTRLAGVIENTSTLLLASNISFTSQLGLLQASVETIIQTTLRDIQIELNTSSTTLRANISLIEDETLPMLRVMVEEEYKAHVKAVAAR